MQYTHERTTHTVTFRVGNARALPVVGTSHVIRPHYARVHLIAGPDGSAVVNRVTVTGSRIDDASTMPMSQLFETCLDHHTLSGEYAELVAAARSMCTQLHPDRSV